MLPRVTAGTLTGRLRSELSAETSAVGFSALIALTEASASWEIVTLVVASWSTVPTPSWAVSWASGTWMLLALTSPV